MAPVTKIAQMDETTRLELDRRLVANGFGGYLELEAWLRDSGYEIGKSTIHRHGQALERKLEAIRASTQAALMISEAAPDDEDARSSAVLSMIQSDLFNGLLALQDAAGEDDPAERLKILSTAAKAIADVSRASVGVKRHAEDVRKKAAEAAERIDGIGRGADIPAEVLERIKEQVYGLA